VVADPAGVAECRAYFDQLWKRAGADVKAIDQAMNVERRPNFDITQSVPHAMHSVIVAALAGTRPARAHRGIRTGTRGFHPSLKERFTRLVDRGNSNARI
jgi:hypothetical protein